MLAAICTLGVLACERAPTAPTAPPPLAPLTTETWHMIEADGQSLPAVIAHRLLPGNVLEQSVLESATLRVDANGSYEQLFRVRTLVDGESQANVLVQDIGAWTAAAERYELASDTRPRTFRIALIANGQLSTVEQMVFRAEAGLVRGVYVPAAPTQAQ